MSGELSRRGPFAKTGAQLPGIQTSRVQDPNTRQALEALREWVEVRLGARGDPYERAVTQRDLEQTVKGLQDQIDALKAAVAELKAKANAAT